jgi:hypothetical protein
MSRLRCINRVSLTRENAYRRLEREQREREHEQREKHNLTAPVDVPPGNVAGRPTPVGRPTTSK